MTPHHVPVTALPPTLYQDALCTIASYTISLVTSDRTPESQRPCAGVLANYGGQRGILTARHVAERVKRSADLAMLVGLRHFHVDPQHLVPRQPPAIERANVWEALLPDISFIPLPLPTAEQLQDAGKAFYGIDRRVNDPSFDLHGDDGFYLATGGPLGMVDHERGQLVQLRFATDVEQRAHIHCWDYVVVNMNLQANPQLPESLHGMSGGGLWRIRFQVDDEGLYAIDDPAKDVTLHGVICLQTNGSGRQLIAHGPASVYQQLPIFLASA